MEKSSATHVSWSSASPMWNRSRKSKRIAARIVLRPGFSFVRGTLEATLHIVDAVAPTSARYTISNKGIGSSAEVEATVSLSPLNNGTARLLDRGSKDAGRLVENGALGTHKRGMQKVVNLAWDEAEAKLSRTTMGD